MNYSVQGRIGATNSERPPSPPLRLFFPECSNDPTVGLLLVKEVTVNMLLKEKKLIKKKIDTHQNKSTCESIKNIHRIVLKKLL